MYFWRLTHICEHSGEASWIVLLRGTMAMASIVALSVFSVYAIVLGPMDENSLTPIKEYRIRNIWNAPRSTNPVVWNVVVVGSSF